MNKKLSLTLAIIVIAVIIIGFFGWDRAQAPNGVNFGQTSTPEKQLSDEDLRNYAKSDFDKKEMAFKDLVIGTHNGNLVKVTFPCSDVCPDATMRIIRYEVENEQCETVGGELKFILVPMAIAVMAEEFCFPKAIVESGIYEFVEFQP